MRKEELKGYHRRQIDNKQMKLEDEFRLEQEHSTKTQALLDHHEKYFYSYAEQCMQEWDENGKNIKPLMLELKSYKKRLVA